MKIAWGYVTAVYEWLADIVADYPKMALAVILILLVAAVL